MECGVILELHSEIQMCARWTHVLWRQSLKNSGLSCLGR